MRDLNSKDKFQPNGLFRPTMGLSSIPEGSFPFYVRDLNLPWQEAFNFGKRLKFAQGETLAASLECGRYFYYLISGALQTWYEDEPGQLAMHMVMGPGMLFNDMVCLSGIHKNDTISFIRDSCAVRFDKETIFTHDFCQTHANLLLNMACSIARKGLLLVEFKRSGAQMGIINHVARILLTIALQDREREPVGMTQDNMGKILRVHRSSITRVIRELKDMGVISKSTKNNLVIEDFEKLKELAVGEKPQP